MVSLFKLGKLLSWPLAVLIAQDVVPLAGLGGH